jgi:hypothetical protein
LAKIKKVLPLEEALEIEEKIKRWKWLLY